MVNSVASLSNLHPRLPGEERAIHEKFRPNIVLDGVQAWDEDLWASLTFPQSGCKLILTSIYARCRLVIVDLEHGKMGDGESGQLLTKMMKDRIVDSGKKWEPVFGRYGFPTSAGTNGVGDKVKVERGEKTSVWIPRLSTFEEALTQNVPYISAPPSKYRAATYIVTLSIVLALAKWYQKGYV